MTQPLPRYRPDDPWPAYAYLPGRAPHPTRDPEGHSRGQHVDDSLAEAPEHWSRCPRYLRGADLYNHGYGWEAHEVWEAMWLRPRDAAQEELLKALIQMAASTVQDRNGHARGRQRLCRRAVEHLRAVQGLRGFHYMGIDLEPLVDQLTRYGREGGNPPILHLYDPSEP